MTAQHNDHSLAVRPLQGQTATIASLSRREKKPDQGEKRRKQVAAVLGMAGGVGAVLAVKSASTAMALWAGAPALVVAGAGLASVMALSGSLGYFKQRAGLKAAGQVVPPFRFKDLAKSLFTSKAALVAGGMTALAAALPGALLVAASGGVAALGAGLHEYKSRRAYDRARGLDVGAPSIRDAFKTIFQSKSAGSAFLLSVGIGSVLSLVTGTSWSASDTAVASDTSADSSADSGARFHEGTIVPLTAVGGLSVAPSAEPTAPMPEMAIITPAAPVAPAAPAIVASEVTAPEVVESEVIDSEAEARAPSADSAVMAPEDLSAPVVTAPAPDEILQDTTGPDCVRQIIYGSGITETIYPGAGADISPAVENLPAADPVVDDAVEEEVVSETQAPETKAPVSEAPLSRTIVHESGVIETITPLYAEAAQPPAAQAPVINAPVANTPVAEAPVQTVGECVISEDEAEIRIDCKLDVNAEMQPGSSIDFRAAAHPDKILQASLPADAAPINAGIFLEEKALPGAHAAYEKGYFKPEMP